jgi:hypothetical protein
MGERDAGYSFFLVFFFQNRSREREGEMGERDAGYSVFFSLSVGEEGVSARVAGGEGACGVREHARSLSRPGGL